MQKPVQYVKCVDILQQFQKRYRKHGLPPKRNEIALRVVARPPLEHAQLEIEVVVLRKAEGPAGETPEVFDYHSSEGVRRIRTRVVEGTLPKASGGVCGGDPVAGQKQTSGTLGWFFYLNGDLMGISNWHVIEKNEKITATSRRSGQSAYGVVTWDSPVRLYPETNDWDLSLAKMDPNDVVAEMTDASLNYPSTILDNPSVADGATYATVGAGHRGTSEGPLIAVRTGYVDYGYDWAYFAEQLEFDAPTQAGDSGSVIIRLPELSVAGIVFASYPTLASPLYKLGWEPGGKSGGFPAFTK